MMRSAFIAASTALIASLGACSQTDIDFSYQEESCEVYYTVLAGYIGNPGYLQSDTTNTDNGLYARSPLPNSWIDAANSPDCYPIEDEQLLQSCLENQVELEQDISSWGGAVFDSPVRSLSSCELEKLPQFSEGTFINFKHDESMDKWNSDNSRIPYITVSNVAFSPNRDSALIALDYPCSGLCGMGYFILLKNDGEEWTVSGSMMSWIS